MPIEFFPLSSTGIYFRSFGQMNEIKELGFCGSEHATRMLAIQVCGRESKMNAEAKYVYTPVRQSD